MLFTGLYTALITPFKNDSIDVTALKNLVEMQIEAGVAGIILCGTTGECPTLTYEEHDLIIETAVKTAKGRTQIIAGTGSNSTAEAISLTKSAKKYGADACLVVTPYYNKPNQEGIYHHFKAVNDEGELPIIIYNIPSRCVVKISNETLARLSKLEFIHGVKDSTGDLASLASLRLMVDEKFCLISGEDATALGFNAMGGRGVISVTSNIAPKLCNDLQQATLRGDFARALQIQDNLDALHNLMFCDTNPAPVKYAASLMGLCGEDLRLPLTLPSQENKRKIEEGLKEFGLIPKLTFKKGKH